MKYEIIYAGTAPDLQDKVNLWIEEHGYQPLGGLAFEGFKFYQAMIKYD